MYIYTCHQSHYKLVVQQRKHSFSDFALVVTIFFVSSCDFDATTKL